MIDHSSAWLGRRSKFKKVDNNSRLALTFISDNKWGCLEEEYSSKYS